LYRLDAAPPRKRYSWADEELAEPRGDDELELPRPDDVPVLWHRPRADAGTDSDGERVIRFVRRDDGSERPRIH
jgi:hypothetical protein